MLPSLLLAWYDQHKRVLPFRGTRDAYRVWVSEIMLQQTRTETVGAYYTRFLARFPDVLSLAAAQEQDVLKCWEGLGYYSRARNLQKAARIIAEKYGGVFPANAEALRALPGVGDYTAAAVASIAFDLPTPAMDGNLTRVLSRVHGVREDVAAPSVRRRLLELAREDMPAARCGDFNQALMDLGATVCTPGTPDCGACPLAPLCDARAAGDAEELPIKAAAAAPKAIQLAVALVTCRGRVLLTQRKEKLLEGLWVYPLLENAASPSAVEKGLRALGVKAVCRENLGPARHVFTHRIWNMTIFHCAADSLDTQEGRFFSSREMTALPMPTAMRAARERALDILTPRVLRADSASLPEAARVYAVSWQASHGAQCSPAFLQEHTPQNMEMLLRGHESVGRDVYTLRLEEKIIGILVLDRGENELVSLYIHPDYQGMGAGRAAVMFAIGALDESRDMKVTDLCDNQRARRLYESCGFREIRETRVLNPERNVKEEVRIRKGRRFLPLTALCPSQLYISEEKLNRVRAWFRPDDLTGFEPVPVKRSGDRLFLTDGHTRAAAACLAGMEQIPVCDETDELDWEAYDQCLRWCREEGVETIAALARRVVSPADYSRLWSARCDRLFEDLTRRRGK